MGIVGVMAAYSDPWCLCVVHYIGRHYIHTHTHAPRSQYVAINTDLAHVNGHDRTTAVIFAKHCTRLPEDGSFVIRNMLEHF